MIKRKMKRYVKEYANEFLRNPTFPVREKGRISRVLTCCEKGVCTAVEAVSIITGIADSIEGEAANV